MTTEVELRERIVAEARSWLGTPYHHAARVKGAGVDCAMLLAAVYEGCDLIAPVAFDRYPPNWMIHRDGERLLDVVATRAHEIEEPGQPGDLVLYRFGRAFAHGAIVIIWPTIIHALQGSGAILDTVDGPQLADRARKVFSLF